MKKGLLLATALSLWILSNGEPCMPNLANPLPSKRNCHNYYSVASTPLPEEPGTREHCRFSHETFKKLPSNCKLSTQHISMFECCLKKLTQRTLTKYHAVECLDLPFNKITALQNQTFTGNKDLKKIYLSNNKIAKIEAESFYGLTNLVVLDLSHNLLTSISEQVFHHTPNLEILRLDNNLLVSVKSLFTLQSPVIFPSLEDLSLSNNSISEWPFTNLNKLTDLNLSLNQLHKWTRDYSKTIPMIRRLNLSNNSIKGIVNPFESNRKLISLDLSNNCISSLEKDFVENLCSLTSIHLNGNKLREAHPEWFAAIARNFKSRTYELAYLDVSLENNLWQCDCNFNRMKEFFKFLKRQPEYQTKDWELHIKFKCSGPHGGANEQGLHDLNLNHCPHEEKSSYLSGMCREISHQPSTSPIHRSSSLHMIFIAAACGIVFLIAIGICYRQFSKQKPKPDAQTLHENRPLSPHDRQDHFVQYSHPSQQRRSLPPLPEAQEDVIEGYMNITRPR